LVLALSQTAVVAGLTSPLYASITPKY
jgi:hypothetical protein